MYQGIYVCHDHSHIDSWVIPSQTEVKGNYREQRNQVSALLTLVLNCLFLGDEMNQLFSIFVSWVLL